MERRIQGKKHVAMEMVDVPFIYRRGPGLGIKFGGNSIPAIIHAWQTVHFGEMKNPGELRLPGGINSGERRGNGDSNV